ncbi:hypothetical protein K402DRAFT_422971 [Aulographum hederae CBS 113979]|uniref:FAD-binding PCMH-type domain-containing protein n=1 Tax=Aulographum hederae CBS 113979 TaxID=1176131 RepID=A0A6G1GUK1_9PEZI|nr:hypothetical protein K402DRAFT_422971 [Aulographum hederae CBS 113979]
MKGLSAILSVALLAAPSLQHAAMLPPNPDKVLTPNSSNAPAGCKLLASDRGFPTNETVVKELPKAVRKQWGTLGPDWTIKATSVKDVQDAIKFAKTHNIRLSVITTGHDFHGRNNGRSGLRLDLSGMVEPIVFAPSWKEGDVLTPPATTACPAGNGSEMAMGPSLKPKKYRFFRRHGPGDEEEGEEEAEAPPASGEGSAGECAKLIRRSLLKKRHGPGEEGAETDAYNVITPVPGQQAVARVSAAIVHEVFYLAADKSNLFVMGAQHGGVSAIGGWMQGGGHNPFAPDYGMQVDQVVEMEVVTADGKFQKVSESKNPDLFWALRGGGGSTFGIVTAATVKVHPTIPIAVGRFILNSTSPKLYDSLAHFLQVGPDLRDKYGVMGYFYHMPKAFQSSLHMPGKFATLENAKAAFEPLVDDMFKMSGGTVRPQVQYTTYKTYAEWYAALQGTEEMEEAGEKFLTYYDGSDGSVPSQSQAMENPLQIVPFAMKSPQNPSRRSLHVRDLSKRDEEMEMYAMPMSRTYLDSRLVSAQDIKAIPLAQLSAALRTSFVPTVQGIAMRGFLYGGGKQAAPKADAMGLNPAWRTSTYHLIMNAVPGDARHDYDISALRRIFPRAGAYVNEAAPQTTDWKTAFWGSNYAKLETLKKRFDPDNVFFCTPCVGADMWTYDDERICRNPRYPSPAGTAAPQTLPNMQSKVGIASLPGVKGVPNALAPIIEAFMKNGTLPKTMPDFHAGNGLNEADMMAGGMGFVQAGAAGGGNMGGMDMGEGEGQMGGMEGMDMGAESEAGHSHDGKRARSLATSLW